MPKKFTDRELRNYARYEKVRASNRYNMIQDQRAQQATGLDRDDYLFVIENFEALEAQYNAQQAATKRRS